MPIYTTNKDANGFIATYTVPAIATVLLLVLFIFNSIGWGIVGAVELVRLVTG